MLVDDFSNIPSRPRVFRVAEESKQKLHKILENADKKVTNLGLELQIALMRDEKIPIRRISEKLSISEQAVKSISQPYDKLSKANKKEFQVYARDNSVFNFRDRAEELFADCKRMMRLVDENPELYKEYLSEARQMLKLAKELYEAAMRQTQQQEEMNIFLEEIRKASPEVANAILKRIQLIRQSRGLLGG